MNNFFRNNGILILIIAILLALITAVVSIFMGGIANPLANVVGIVSTPVRNGINAVVSWAEAQTRWVSRGSAIISRTVMRGSREA